MEIFKFLNLQSSGNVHTHAAQKRVCTNGNYTAKYWYSVDSLMSDTSIVQYDIPACLALTLRSSAQPYMMLTTEPHDRKLPHLIDDRTNLDFCLIFPLHMTYAALTSPYWCFVPSTTQHCATTLSEYLPFHDLIVWNMPHSSPNHTRYRDMWDGKPIFGYREPTQRNTDAPSAFAAGTNPLNNSYLLFASLHFRCNVIWSILQVHDEIAQLAADFV